YVTVPARQTGPAGMPPPRAVRLAIRPVPPKHAGMRVSSSRAAASGLAASGLAPRVKAVLGPTNTGKTHLAIERMLAHASGVIGFPLRLLARENYDRMVARKGVQH